MDEIVSIYNNFEDKNGLELEFIISNNHITIKKIIDSLNHKPFKIQKQIDIYEDNKRIRKLLLEKKVIYEKKEFIKSVKIDNITLNLKKEIPLEKFYPKNITSIRLKFINIYMLDDWQLEHSKIKEFVILQTSKEHVKNLEESKSIDDDLLKHFTNESLELEYIGNKNINLDKMKTTFSELIQSINPKKDILIREIQSFKGTNNKILSLKTILPNVDIMSRINYSVVNSDKEHYVITEKTDGERGILSIADGGYLIITDSLTIMGNLDNKTLSIMFEGEILNDKFYAWDVLKKNDRRIYKLAYKERLTYLEPIKFKSGKIKEVIVKNIVPLEGNAKKIYNTKRDYEIDGLIITSTNKSYFDTKIYKWKEDHTIDFLVLGSKGNYILFVGIDEKTFHNTGIKKIKDYDILTKGIKMNNKYFPIQFSTPRGHFYEYKTNDKNLIKMLDKNNSNIVEFSYAKNKWDLIKIREDRRELLDKGIFYGNNYKTASSNLELHFSKLNLDELDNFTSKEYFKKSSTNSIYKNPNGYNSFIKNEIMSMKSGNLIDIGAGKGQDIRRYKIYYSNVVAIEPDNEAITEFISREASYEGKSNIRIFNSTFLEFDNNDFTNWADMITINFAIHYIIVNIESLYLLKKSVDKFLKKGGYFSFICYDGENLKNILEKNNGKFERYDKDILKYSIKHKVKSEEITSNEIEVLLPFSNGKYYTEHLVDINKLIKIFDYKIIKYESISEKFKDSFNLSYIDKEYLSLYYMVVLEK